MKRAFGSPQFLTNKVSIKKLSTCVYDFQLKEHFLNMSNLNVLQCECMNHKHNKDPCRIVFEPMCPKCKRPTRLLVSYQSMLFHDDLATKKLTKCIPHEHTPPCRRCINCNTGLPCIVTETFQCTASTDVVCSVDNTRFNKDMLDTDILLHEHIYNTKTPTFYFCFVHSHHHISHPTLPCVIQTYKCCDAAVFVKDFTKCFLVKTESMTAMKKAAGKKPTAAMPAQPTFDEYIIFDPAIWREQSYNHFMSFVRAIIALPEAVAERYLRFENSNFTISNVKKYISTKESVIRSAVTGFETYGIYQTAIISCSIPYYAVVIPQKLYDLLEVDHFDLDLVMVLRHPSIKTTCMYICKAMRNSDPNVDVIVISDQQSVGLNQDQDGDQNGVFLFKKQINGYDATKSYFYKVAKMELAAAFRKKQTLIGQPRYYLSETSLLKIKRNAADFMHLDFFRKTYKDGIKFMNEAAAGYLSKEYDEFQEALCLHNKTERPSYLGVDDFCLDTDRIPSIVSSGAQTNADLIPMALNNVSSDKTLKLLEKDMLALCNNYISSSKDLSRNGRKAFAALYASHDMVAFLGNLYINKVVYANYNKFASAFAFLFNEASLELCIRELEELPDAQ